MMNMKNVADDENFKKNQFSGRNFYTSRIFYWKAKKRPKKDFWTQISFL